MLVGTWMHTSVCSSCSFVNGRVIATVILYLGMVVASCQVKRDTV